MTYRGIVKGNIVTLEATAHIADGTRVEIIPIDQADPICGIWQDDRTAEEIVRDLRNSRRSRDRNISL